MLVLAAVLAGATAVYLGEHLSVAISASFIVVVLAAAFLGPAYAALAAVLAELVTSLRIKTRPYALVSNLLANMLPALVAGNILRALSPGRPHGISRSTPCSAWPAWLT